MDVENCPFIIQLIHYLCPMYNISPWIEFLKEQIRGLARDEL